MILALDSVGMVLKHSGTHLMLLWCPLPPSYLCYSVLPITLLSSLLCKGQGLDSVICMVCMSGKYVYS